MQDENYDLEAVQKKVFGILNCLDEFCKKHKISYFLVGGSLLGAVRHQGFIPWDDDIDIGMRREDYDKFLSLSHELDGNYEVLNFCNDKSYVYVFSKMYDTRTTVIEDLENNYKKGVWLDIFPIDSSSNQDLMRKIHFSCIRFFKTLIATKKGSYKSGNKIFLRRLMKIISGFFPDKKLFHILDFLLNFYNLKNTNYMGNLVGRWGARELMRAEIFNEIILLDFNGGKFPALKAYDEYLTRMYGDYMQLPPPNKRVVDHGVVYVNLEKSYKTE